MFILFKKTKILEKKLQDFLHISSESAHTLLQGVQCYLQGERVQFDTPLEKIRQLEFQADSLRREIEEKLYAETLIPESRGDVLAILENTDTLINMAKDVLLEFSIEAPQIHPQFHGGFLALTQLCADAIDEISRAVIAFMENPMGIESYRKKVRHFIEQVKHHEKQADKVARELKQLIFKSDSELAVKLQLRDLVVSIDSLADRAEDVSDRIAIYTLKRSV